MENWRPDGIVGGNQTGFWGAVSFCLCRLRTDRCSSLLSCWTHASHLAGRIKYLSTVKLVKPFRAGINSDAQTSAEEGITGTWRVSPRCVLAVERSLGSAVPDCYPTATWKVSLVICSSLDRWVWFVWGINHQLVRNRFESPSLLDSEHLTRATTS